jgi:tetratricopeptide (TPR) repeat protein
MSAPPPPAKLKTALAFIKEAILDTKDGTVSLRAYFMALLRVELLLRGALVSDSPESSLTQPINNIVLLTVQTHAGKSLKDESSLPKQLLAGSSFIAGRIAEKIGQMLADQSTLAKHSSNNKLNNTSSSLLWDSKESDKELIESCTLRCRQVEDERFSSLLQLAQGINGAAASAADVALAGRAFFVVAEGYFLRAAHSSPDAPPMWKKAWDCVSMATTLATAHDGESTSTIAWPAITAITNLQRIALSKDNRKRAAELSLILVDCYLDMAAATASPVPAAVPFAAQLRHVWIAPWRPIAPPRATPIQAVVQAKATLDQLASLSGGSDDTTVSNLLSVDEDVYRMLLQVRVWRAEWEALVESIAQTNHARAMNRAASTDGPKAKATAMPPSLQSCRKEVRRQQLSEPDDTVNDLQQAAMVLRDKLVDPAMVGSSRSFPHYSSGWNVLSEHLEWLLERARVQATKAHVQQAWPSVHSFIDPMYRAWRTCWGADNYASTAGPMEDVETTILALEREIFSASPEEARCVEAVCCAIPHVEWMMWGPQSPLNHCTDTFLFLILKALENHRLDARSKKATSTVISSDSTLDVVLSTLDGCLSFVRAVWALGQSPTESDHIWHVTDVATVRSTPAAAINSFIGAVGSEFGEFLVAWSGFHTRSWPFCTQPQARRMVQRARDCILEAKAKWGRPIHAVELTLLDMGEADAEGLAFDVGLVNIARKNYSSAMALAESFSDKLLAGLVIAHCYTGLAALAMRENPDAMDVNRVISLARSGLERLQTVDAGDGPLFLWLASGFVEYTLRFQIAASRQLVADSILQSGQVDGALAFLEDAVRDAPQDASAAFALGRFKLYTMLFGAASSPQVERDAQVQLLRAAKMDSSKAGPFALLGYWYEYKSDVQRAIGCYSKALLLDPTHLVAGRGIVRLAPRDSLDRIVDMAISSVSTVTGWAWRAMGIQKSLSDGKDDLAIVSFLKALRCRDIVWPQAEPMGAFYGSPAKPTLPNHDELSSTFALLAACYRRIGRFTAAIRSYHTAIQKAKDNPPPSMLCACALVELELGLFDEAVEKLSMAMNCGDRELFAVAVYGYGAGMLSIARRAAQDGKAGLAFNVVCESLHALDRMNDSRSICVLKLKGDLYSFGASLPARVFGGNDAATLSQVEFVEKGALAYETAQSLVMGSTEESNLMRASLLTDVGSNLILQGQLMTSLESKGLRLAVSPAVSRIYQKAASEFHCALDLSPTYAPAWCALGCALVHSDPIMAQHAFSRSIELDKLFPDAYANLSFLYTSHQRYEASASVSDALTAVADTPMMWINRALMFEQTALQFDSSMAQNYVLQAADAYRAALQVTKHPIALLGLSLSCRSLSSRTKQREMISESYSCASEYVESFGSYDILMVLVESALEMEVGITENRSEHSEYLIEEGRQHMLHGINIINVQGRERGENVIPDVSVFHPVTHWNKNEHLETAQEPDEEVDAAWSLHRQVVHSPNRGDIWLLLAKQLARKADAEQRTAAHPALVAARRASSILRHQLEQSCLDSTSVVRAQDLSDALALQFWLEALSDAAPASIQANPADEVTRSNKPSIVELQRSLLICPGSTIARQALRLSIDRD